MAQGDTRLLQQIKQETEQTRADLTETVEQLRASVTETASDIRQRIRPDAIKAEVKDYVRTRGEQLLDDVTAAAKRNPIQAAAVAVSIAYPLLRLARGIPLRVLMVVGAGLFLAGSKTGQSATQKASEVASDLSDEVLRRIHDLRDQLGEPVSAGNTAMSAASEEVKRAVRAAAEQGSSSTARSKGKVTPFGSAAGNRVVALGDQAAGVAGSATSAFKDLGSTATSAGRNAATTTRDAGLHTARALRETVSDVGKSAGTIFARALEQNPLLVASVGLLVGGLIASALPRPEIEDGRSGGRLDQEARRSRRPTRLRGR